MSELISYFSNSQIIKYLIKRRSLIAKERHDLHFHRNISSSAKNPSTKAYSLTDLFPPRSQWIRPKLSERKFKHSLKVNQISLLKTINYYWTKNLEPIPSWLENLKHYVADIHYSALSDSSYIIEPPKILPIRNKESNPECRPIAIYSTKDRVVISQVAKYLMDCFDDDFLDCSYAFRSGGDTIITPNHHHAAEKIFHYMKLNEHKAVWVAECDIKKFYDSVNHEVAIESLNLAINRASKRGVRIHPRAIEIFSQYLASYSFTNNILPLNLDQEHFKKHGISNGYYGWISETEYSNRYSETPHSYKIGIPQGGAISCLIANLVLHRVDEKITQTINGNDYLYVRYCDDMIVLSPKEDECQKIYKLYEESINDLNMWTHSPEKINYYNKSFWNQKSKYPYLCGDSNINSSAVPWVSFVGYQIRYDSKVRVRPSSIQKELRKQKNECDKILHSLEIAKNKKPLFNTTDKSKGQIVYRLQQRLISMSVGRIKYGVFNKNSAQFCWTSGFQFLFGKNIVKSQIKKLDKNRNRQIARLFKKLKYNRHKNMNTQSQHNMSEYYGKPYSYIKQFE